MPDSPAIQLENVSKIYRLYGSQRHQLLDVLGLSKFLLSARSAPKQFVALNGISLEIPRGQRLAIVGRNGAGKTTLLKLVCGNFAPTSGLVTVNGRVQALLSAGLGFHPDHTGRENVQASLQYNGLSRSEYGQAMAEVIDFCELGDFIDQPFKTYSLGMQGRLMFAAATAIKPEILIIDEVLGAGDAYFVAKSKQRIDNLVKSGCTMLLVSHSMQTVLDLCHDAIWLESGQIRMRGDAFRVVKAFEEDLHGPIKRLTEGAGEIDGASHPQVPAGVRASDTKQTADVAAAVQLRRRREIRLQEPTFLPHEDVVDLPSVSLSEAQQFRFQAPGGISRWAAEGGLKICGFSIVSHNGVGNTVRILQPVRFVFFLLADHGGHFDCRYGFVLFDASGNVVLRICSPPDNFSIDAGGLRRIEMTLNPNQLGAGDYTISLSVHENSPLEMLNSSRRYDLLNRSFEMKVKVPDSLAVISCAFFQTAEWSFQSGVAAE